jgi:plasmid stabilization system protein ParE
MDHIRQRYGPEVETEQLFDRRRPGGRVLTLDGYPHQGQPIMLTEFGGITYQQHAEEGVKKVWGYTEIQDAEAFARAYEVLLETIIQTALFSGFCYTQFADTFQEANGLLHADRTPKIPLERIRKVTSISRTYIPGAA